jgi:hypothetical protein
VLVQETHNLFFSYAKDNSKAQRHKVTPGINHQGTSLCETLNLRVLLANVLYQLFILDSVIYRVNFINLYR